MAGVQTQPLLSQTVLPAQTINGRVVTQTIQIPAGAKSGKVSCPNISPAHVTDPTKQLQIDVEFSLDQVNWQHHVGGGLWEGNAQGVAPGAWGTQIDPQFVGVFVRAWVDDKGTGVSTDLLAEID